MAKEEEKSGFLAFIEAYFYDSNIGTILVGSFLLIVLMVIGFLKI